MTGEGRTEEYSVKVISIFVKSKIRIIKKYKESLIKLG